MRKMTIYVVPHSHYDAAWLKTYEGAFEIRQFQIETE